MAKYIRTAPGNHSFRKNGKLITVQQGQVVEATKEDLGSELAGYQVYKGQLGDSKLEQETNRYVFIERPKSVWLNPEGQRGSYGPLTLPNNLEDLEKALFYKEDTGLTTGKPGELPRAKFKLREAWDDWKYVCSCDPLSKMDEKNPVDRYLEGIAKAQAKVLILEAEIKEIKTRIRAARKPVDMEKKNRIRTLSYKGIYHCNADREIIEVDGREVVQDADDVAVFADDRTYVHEYLLECKKHKREQAMAIRKRAKKRTRSAKA